MIKLKSLTTRRLLIWLLLVPTLLAIVYYTVLARGRYVSENIVAVLNTQAGTATPGTVTTIGTLTGSTNPVALSDTMYLQSYLQSEDLLDKLQSSMQIRQHYANGGLDVFYRIYSWMSKEYFLTYFRNRVTSAIDPNSGLITVEVEAFDPAYAQRMGKAIIEQGDEFLNGYWHKIALDRLKFTEEEVSRSWKRSQNVKAQLIAFQSQHKLLDPVALAQANTTLTSTLQANLNQQEAALKAALGYMQEDSYQVKVMRDQIAATRSQLSAEAARGTTGDASDQLASLQVQYQTLLTQAGFFDTAYQAALLATEQARMDSTRRLRWVVVVEQPTKPESAIYPQRLYDIATVFVLCLIFFGIARLIVATIREHLD